jgi:ABC-2 type transport system permease protein
MNPRITAAIARKDLIDAIVNLRLLVSIVLPIGLSLFFGYLFGGFTGDGAPASSGPAGTPPPVKLPVYDPGDSRLTRQLEDLPGYLVIRQPSLTALQAAVDAGQGPVGLVLPSDFDLALARGETPVLTLVIKDDPGQTGRLVGPLTDQLRELAGQVPPAELMVETINRPPGRMLTARQLNLPTWLALSLAVVGTAVIPTMLVEEKERWTLRALMVTRATYTDVIVGKALVGMAYVLATAVILLALNDGLVGQVGLSLAAIVVGGAALVELGLLLGGICDDLTTLNTWSTVFTLVLMLPGMLAGLFSSNVFKLGVLELVVRLIPTFYVIDLVQAGMAGRASLEQVLVNLGLLGGLMVGLFLAVGYTLRRRES